MPLNKQKGNMYGFVTHTWNAIKGVCPHQCSYCYMSRWWLRMKAPRIDESEFKTNLGTDNTIFVGSSIDMWADEIPVEWQENVIKYCKQFDNTYLFQTKATEQFQNEEIEFPDKTILCTTIESNRWYVKCMGNTITPNHRHTVFANTIGKFKKMVTIEPVMNFDLNILLEWMIEINPIQINIGADSGGNHLPEPSKEKLIEFIQELKTAGLQVYEKPNLKRLMKRS